MNTLHPSKLVFNQRRASFVPLVAGRVSTNPIRLHRKGPLFIQLWVTLHASAKSLWIGQDLSQDSLEGSLESDHRDDVPHHRHQGSSNPLASVNTLVMRAQRTREQSMMASQ